MKKMSPFLMLLGLAFLPLGLRAQTPEAKPESAEAKPETTLTEDFENVDPSLSKWAAVKGGEGGDADEWRPAAKWDEFLTMTLVTGEGESDSKCIKLHTLQKLTQLQFYFAELKVPPKARKMRWKFSMRVSDKVPEAVIQYLPRDGETLYMKELSPPLKPTMFRPGKSWKEYKGDVDLDPNIVYMAVMVRFPELPPGVDIFVDNYFLEFQ